MRFLLREAALNLRDSSRRSDILEEACCGDAAPRSDPDAFSTFFLRGWSEHFQPRSGPEVGPGLALGITYPSRPGGLGVPQ